MLTQAEFRTNVASLIKQCHSSDVASGGVGFDEMIDILAETIASGITIRMKNYPEAAVEHLELVVAMLRTRVAFGIAGNFAHELGGTTH
jgi:hypothetical protein